MCNRFRTDLANRAIWQAIQEWREAEAWEELGQNELPLEMFPNTPGRILSLLPSGAPRLSTALWGLPSPPAALVTPTGKPKSYDGGITNVRNTTSPHWRRWLGPDNRCLVPFTSFCEPDQASGSKADTWFEFTDGRPMGWFAGVRLDWTRQIRAKDPHPTAGEFFAFLTTEPNAEVASVHPKAMPVILQTGEECERWLTQPWESVKDLQRPLPDGTLTIVRPA